MGPRSMDRFHATDLWSTGLWAHGIVTLTGGSLESEARSTVDWIHRDFDLGFGWLRGMTWTTTRQWRSGLHGRRRLTASRQR